MIAILVMWLIATAMCLGAGRAIRRANRRIDLYEEAFRDEFLCDECMMKIRLLKDRRGPERGL